MEKQYNKVGVYFKKNDDNTYSVDGVYNFDLDENKDLLNDCNSVYLSSENLLRMKHNESFDIVDDNKEEKESFAIILDKNVYDRYYNECLNSEITNEEDINNNIIDMLNDFSGNIKDVSIEKIKDLISYKFEFKEKKMEMNSSSSKVVSNNSKKEKIEIDMSKVNPDEIIDKIKGKVIAQDNAVETIVNNIYNNQLLLDTKNEDLISSSKSSILLDGPTGTGKTLIVKEVANELSIPMITRSATSFSAAGYKGADLSEMLVSLLKEANGDIETAQRGIIVLDEFDKLGGKVNSELDMKKAVQQELLTYLSGAKFNIEYNGKNVEFDTSHVTFICLGAFTDLREKKISEELTEDGKYTMKPDDYIKDGLMREIVGRFSLITATQSLGKDDLIKILKESKISPLFQLKEMCKMYNKELVYDDEIIEKIATEALEEDTGARALQVVVNGMRNVLLSDMRKNNIDKIELNDEILLKSKEVYQRSVRK